MMSSGGRLAGIGGVYRYSWSESINFVHLIWQHRGDEYTIADMAIFPWYGAVLKNHSYDAAEFLEAHSYTNLFRWVETINQRDAVKRGMMVNRPFGAKEKQLLECHDVSDFELRTQDMLDPDSDPEETADSA